MKIYISADLEGICGIVHWDCTSSTGYDYVRARMLMTQEVNAAIRGAVRAGAGDVVVNDAHNTMTNILIEELDPAARLITGSPKQNSMMEGLDQTFDGAMLIGYHSRMNGGGVLNHTYSSRTVYNLSINGKDAGEFSLNAYIAGHFNVPVILASGDDQLVREAKGLIEGINAVSVKRAIGRYAAECLNPKQARTLIEENAYRAVLYKDKVKPLPPEAPICLQVTLMDSGMADAAGIMPGTERISANVLSYTAPDILTAYKAFRTITALAGTSV